MTDIERALEEALDRISRIFGMEPTGSLKLELQRIRDLFKQQRDKC